MGIGSGRRDARGRPGAVRGFRREVVDETIDPETVSKTSSPCATKHDATPRSRNRFGHDGNLDLCGDWTDPSLTGGSSSSWRVPRAGLQSQQRVERICGKFRLIQRSPAVAGGSTELGRCGATLVATSERHSPQRPITKKPAALAQPMAWPALRVQRITLGVPLSLDDPERAVSDRRARCSKNHLIGQPLDNRLSRPCFPGHNLRRVGCRRRHRRSMRSSHPAGSNRPVRQTAVHHRAWSAHRCSWQPRFCCSMARTPASQNRRTPTAGRC